MTVSVDTRSAIHPEHAKTLDTNRLREEFLIQNIFKDNEMTMTYSHIDRICVGGIMPAEHLIAIPDNLGQQFGVEYFLQRRELGAINIGNDGFVTVDGTEYDVKAGEAIYIAAGARHVEFGSCFDKDPAKFYYASTPAHQTFETVVITKDQSVKADLGDQVNGNARIINKYIVPETVKTCQLSMGLTALKEGSLWNSCPPHTHERRMEVYFYFNVHPEHTVFHMMGQPQETRHVVIHNEEAIISPPWSIHSGVGTQAYSFIWAMCGENLTFDDMDHIAIKDIR